ncbi:MAG: rod shape-determining protein MreC [Bacteroidales bacterium]|nr:rod shape-determining protein MreC [Bacteroidales bacterium]
MQNLFAFLLRYKFFFIFLTMEVVAFSMIINHSFYQRYIFINSANKLTGTLYTWNMGISEYFSLKQVNLQLAEENASLRERLQQSEVHSQLEPLTSNDSLAPLQFDYISAKVISNSTNKRNNYIMIDKGRKQGIGLDMAVISPEGVVGIVINVSDNFAWLMSVLNKNTKINGRLKNSNYQGSLSWDGGNSRYGIFRDVPSHAHLQTGDTIVTSGFSLMFPKDIMIGTITDYFIASGDHFYTVNLQFSVDFNRLSHVYVVKNLMRAEQLSIMKQL